MKITIKYNSSTTTIHRCSCDMNLDTSKDELIIYIKDLPPVDLSDLFPKIGFGSNDEQ